MIRTLREVRRTLVVAGSLCVALAVGLAASQADPMSPSRFAPGALVGEWATQFPNHGGPPTIGTVAYRPDGSYQETLVIGGETVGWWRGRYALAPDGTLVLDESETSPQLCYAGECQPNDPPTRTVARLEAIDASRYSATYVDESGMPATLTFQRVGGGGGPEAGVPGGAPGGVPAVPGAVPGGATAPTTTVPASPMTPGLTAPPPGAPEAGATGPTGADAAGHGASPWIGTWSDGDVTVRIGGADGAVLEVDGATYPLNVSGDETRLAGTFESGGQRYEIALHRTADGLTVSSGGATYALRPAGGATGSDNPLSAP